MYFTSLRHHCLVGIASVCFWSCSTGSGSLLDLDGGSDAGGSGGSAPASGGSTSTGGGHSSAGAGGSSASGGSSSSSGGTQSCDYVPDASLATGESTATLGATAEHNRWRVRVGVPLVRWNTEIAASAQAFADSCPAGHSSNESRRNIAGFAELGENLAGGRGMSIVQAIGNWVAERARYDFGTAISETNFGSFGHYTQIVWKQTTEIGCGVSACGTYNIVCRYGEAGNRLGQTPCDDANGPCLDLDNDDVWQKDDADDHDRGVD